MQQPSIGRAVHVLVDPDGNNGSDGAHGYVTRVWSEAGDGSHTVNYRVKLDAAVPDPWISSGSLYPDEATARASGKTNGFAAFWPARV